MKKGLMEELDRIPSAKLPEIYDLLHHFRLGLEQGGGNAEEILSFSGSWASMPQEDFDDFLAEVRRRREKAISSRKRS